MKKVSPERKREYEIMKQEFRTRKRELTDLIAGHKKDISKLEKQIEEERPKTDNGSYVCKPCDMRSLVYLGRTPQGGAAGGDDIYQCEVCGGDGETTPRRYW